MLTPALIKQTFIAGNTKSIPTPDHKTFKFS